MRLALGLRGITLPVWFDTMQSVDFGLLFRWAGLGVAGVFTEAAAEQSSLGEPVKLSRLLQEGKKTGLEPR